MEENRTDMERSLSHGWEGQRLQQQLLALAYEQLWPVLQTLRTRGHRAAVTRMRQTSGPQFQRASGG